MNENLTKRIGDAYLNATYKDGDTLTHSDLNEIVSVTKTAINENFNDIQRLENGSKTVSNAKTLDGASVSRSTDKSLGESDNEIPTSAQVRDFVEKSIPTKVSTFENDANYITIADVNLSSKVDKVEGKTLSSNDYTDVEKLKLSGIEDGAERNLINTVVDANYQHTDNNYTDNDKAKLDNIEANAQVNVIEEISINGTNFTINNKKASATLETGSGKIDDVKVNGIEQPITNKTVNINVPSKTSDLTNDSGFLTSIPNEYVTETELSQKGYLTSHQDLSNYATKSALNSKQDKLVSGTNIKTINGTSIVGQGNIVIEGGSGESGPTYVAGDNINISDDNVISASIPPEYVKEEKLNSTLSTYVSKEDIKGYAKTTEIPTKTSSLENDSGYLTEVNTGDVKPLAKAIYRNLIATSNSTANGVFYFMKLIPDNFYKPCTVKYKVKACINESMTGSNKNLYNYTGDVILSFSAGSMVKSFANNAFYSGNYAPIAYHSAFTVNETGYTAGLGHMIGEAIYGSTNPLSSTLKRDIEIEILEVDNATYELLDEPILQADFFKTGSYQGYTSIQANKAGLVSTNSINSDTYDRTRYSSLTFKAGSTSAFGSQIIMSSDGYVYNSICNSRSTSTNKTCNTNGFLPHTILYYNGSVTVTNAVSGSSVLYKSIPIDFRYSSNCGGTLTANKSVYLKCTLEDDGLYHLVSGDWYTQDLPTTDDGYYYIYLGAAYSTYMVYLDYEHPVYKYDSTLGHSTTFENTLNNTTKTYVDSKLGDIETILATLTKVGE